MQPTRLTRIRIELSPSVGHIPNFCRQPGWHGPRRAINRARRATGAEARSDGRESWRLEKLPQSKPEILPHNDPSWFSLGCSVPWLWIQKLCVGAIMLVVEFVKHDAFRESSQVRQSPTFWFLKAQAGASQFKKSSLRVACVVSVNAFRQQTFPTA